MHGAEREATVAVSDAGTDAMEARRPGSGMKTEAVVDLGVHASGNDNGGEDTVGLGVGETNSERRYHSTSAAYLIPNDAPEMTRLNAQATAIVQMIGGQPFHGLSYNLPTAGQVNKAIDVGCGTGIATCQLASMYPDAKVYGLNISPVPESMKSTAPENVSWVLGDVHKANQDTRSDDDDVMRDEVFTKDSLDFVFGRMLIFGITDWMLYFANARNAMRPGAIIEHQDIDWDWYRVGTGERLSDAWDWHGKFVASAAKAGLARYPGSGAAQAMEKVGLEVVRVETYKMAFLTSPAIPGSEVMAEYIRTQFLTLFPEMLRKVCGVGGIQGEELSQLTQQAMKDVVSEPGVHLIYTVTIGRKPLTS